MIPVQLSLSGFLSYRDPVDLDFNSFDLACISGPNGAGKSSLLDAITWALFGQARKRDDSLINIQSQTAEVSFTFGYEGNTYRVMRAKPRDKTTLLEFHLHTEMGWKALSERTLRETEARIQETLRLDYETFVNASFFLQGKADQFTQQRPADRKRILGSILGLEVWEQYRKAAAERRKGIEAEIGSLDGRLQEINAELAEEDARVKRLKELGADLEALSAARRAQEAAVEEMRRRTAAVEEQAKLVATLAEQLARAERALDDMESKQAVRQEENAAFAEVIKREAEIEAAHKDWQAARAELERWEETAKQFHEHEARRQEPRMQIEAARALLEKELEDLRAADSAITAGAEEGEGLKQQLSLAQANIESIQSQAAERTELEEQLTAARQKQTAAEAENPLLKEEMDTLKQRIEQLTDVDGAVCPTCGQTLEAHERQELIEKLGAQGKEKGDRYRENSALLASAQEKVAELQKAFSSFEDLDERLRSHTRSFDQLSSNLQQLESDAESWHQEGVKRLKEIETKLIEEKFAPEARAALAEIDAELKEIGYDAAAHDAVGQRESKERASEEELRTLENARAALTPLQREISDLETQIGQQKEEIRVQREAHDEAAASLAAAQAEAPDVREAEREMRDLQEHENKIRLEVGAAQQEVEVLGDLKTRRSDLEGQREERSKGVAQYKAVERAFSKDGVPAMLIEQALPQIESSANQILERLSGGAMSLRFITQQAYKDKRREDLRETLEIQISDSAGQRDYEMYSGGEAFRINFAIRLALSEVLAQRAGARLQTLVIDEGFGSQDEIGRQRLIEAINTVKDDFAKILVITHIDALKDAFPHRIEVEKSPRGSSVQVI